MNRLRWAARAAVAGLGLLSGCTNFGGGCGRERWFSRLTSRSRNAPCEVVSEPCAGPSCGPACGPAGEGPALFDQGANGMPVLPPPAAAQPAVPPLVPAPRVEPQPAQPFPAEPSPASRRK